MFDNVILLAQGQLVYYGPANQALNYFKSLGFESPKNYNPGDQTFSKFVCNFFTADFIVDLVEIQSQNIKQLSQQYRESHFSHQMISQVDASTNVDYDDLLDAEVEQYASAWFTQVYVLCKRTLLNNVRNPYLLRTQYLMMILLSGNFTFFQVYVTRNPSSHRSDLLQTLSGSSGSSGSCWKSFFLDCFIVFFIHEFN